MKTPTVKEFPILAVNRVGNGKWTNEVIDCPKDIDDRFTKHKFRNGVVALVSNFPLPEDIDNLGFKTEAGTIIQSNSEHTRFVVIVDKSLID